MALWAPWAGRMSIGPSRWPVKARVLPSGDQPCQYDGALGVMRRGVPPPMGTIYTRDLWSPAVESLRARNWPSGEMPWSLLQWICGSVGMTVGALPSRARRRRVPSWLKMRYLPSRDQLGASKCAAATYSTRRSVDAMEMVSSELTRTVLPLAGGSCSSFTLEKTVFSTTSLLCEQTPMPM